MPIRTRLTLVFASLSLIVLAVAGAALLIGFRAELDRTINQGLLSRAESARADPVGDRRDPGGGGCLRTAHPCGRICRVERQPPGRAAAAVDRPRFDRRRNLPRSTGSDGRGPGGCEVARRSVGGWLVPRRRDRHRGPAGGCVAAHRAGRHRRTDRAARALRSRMGLGRCGAPPGRGAPVGGGGDLPERAGPAIAGAGHGRRAPAAHGDAERDAGPGSRRARARATTHRRGES